MRVQSSLFTEEGSRLVHYLVRDALAHARLALVHTATREEGVAAFIQSGAAHGLPAQLQPGLGVVLCLLLCLQLFPIRLAGVADLRLVEELVHRESAAAGVDLHDEGDPRDERVDADFAQKVVLLVLDSELAFDGGWEVDALNTILTDKCTRCG